jgi:SAM-dependent methyltransferase
MNQAISSSEKTDQSRAVRDVYAPPRNVTDLADCAFYHTMEIPGHGVIEGPWDLRANADKYLGGIDLRGKRVLEIGTASGFLCFHMEQQGADVVAYDLSVEDDWDVVPFAGANFDEEARKRRQHIDKLNNAWWLAHRAHGSSARAVYGSVYDVPAEIGEVDVATFCAVLRHLRDPFLALERVLRLTRETVVVTANVSLRLAVPQWLAGRGKPCVGFLPNYKTGKPDESFWYLGPDVVKSMIGVLGFERTKTTYHVQRYRGKRRLVYTVVGHRTRGA